MHPDLMKILLAFKIYFIGVDYMHPDLIHNFNFNGGGLKIIIWIYGPGFDS
jgi:hypothetical protein